MSKHFSSYMKLPKQVYILIISKTINSMGNFILPLLTLILTQKIGLTESKAGVYLLILSISYVPGLVLGGKLVDSFGRKRVIIIFHGLAASVFLSCAFIKPSILMVYLLIAGSALLAASMPAYDAIAADLTNSENRKSSYSLLFMGHNLGFAIAPVIGGFLFKRHLSYVFVIDSCTTFISVLLITILIKVPKKAHVHHPNKRKNIEADNGNVWTYLLKNPVLLYFALIIFFYNFAYSQWGFTLPLQLVQIFKDKGSYFYGLMAGLNGLLILLLTPVITRITIRFSTIRNVSRGGLFYAAAFAILIVANKLPIFFIVVIIMTIGEMMVTVNNATFIANNTHPNYRGRVNSIVQMIYGAGFCLGPFIMGKALSIISIRQGWVLISGIILSASILMYILSIKSKKNIIHH